MEIRTALSLTYIGSAVSLTAATGASAGATTEAFPRGRGGGGSPQNGQLPAAPARGVAARGHHRSAGQKRDESGVRISSMTIRSPSDVTPNSNFVSAMMIPRFAA